MGSGELAGLVSSQSAWCLNIGSGALAGLVSSQCAWCLAAPFPADWRRVRVGLGLWPRPSAEGAPLLQPLVR